MTTYLVLLYQFGVHFIVYSTLLFFLHIVQKTLFFKYALLCPKPYKHTLTFRFGGVTL